MKQVLITRDGVTKAFPLTLVQSIVSTGYDEFGDAEILAGEVAEGVDAFLGDSFASDAINYQMIDGYAIRGEFNGCEWKVSE